MATALTSPFVSVEEYLKTDYEPNCEYLDGALFPKAVPDRIHSRLQALLLAFLVSQEEKYGLESLSEQHIRVTPTRFRVPDVCALTQPPTDGRYPGSDTPPLFTIEIASLEEPWSTLRGKITDHLAMGVSLVIVADPYNKTVMLASRQHPLHEISPPLLVDVEVPEAGTLQIDFDNLYCKLGER